MEIKGLTDEDLVQYKKCSMFVVFPTCSFKCERECGVKCCQNSLLAKAEVMDVPVDTLVNRYLANPISKAVVCGGLEPFDSFVDLMALVSHLRKKTDDDIVIYTGYREDEVEEGVRELQEYKNIIVKFGRYVPGQQSKYDEVLGITLASPNQYAKKIS